MPQPEQGSVRTSFMIEQRLYSQLAKVLAVPGAFDTSQIKKGTLSKIILPWLSAYAKNPQLLVAVEKFNIANDEKILEELGFTDSEDSSDGK